MERCLEEERQGRQVATERVGHLEKLILKMEEDAAATEAGEAFQEEAINIVADRVSPKQSTSLPDPPSDDDVLKEKAPTPPSTVTSPDDVPPLGDDKQTNNPHMAEDRDRDDVTAREGRWKWNVAGIWGYVTGEAIPE